MQKRVVLFLLVFIFANWEKFSTNSLSALWGTTIWIDTPAFAALRKWFTKKSCFLANPCAEVMMIIFFFAFLNIKKRCSYTLSRPRKEPDLSVGSTKATPSV